MNDKICLNCRYSIISTFQDRSNIENYYCTWYKIPGIRDNITGRVKYIWKNQTQRDVPYELCIVHNKFGNCSKFEFKETRWEKFMKKLRRKK